MNIQEHRVAVGQQMTAEPPPLCAGIEKDGVTRPPRELQCCGEMPGHSRQAQSSGLSLTPRQSTPMVLRAPQQPLTSKESPGARVSGSWERMAQQPRPVQSLPGTCFSESGLLEVEE